MESRHRTLLLVAFATVYVVWGSTYLAIRIAVESIPPFAMAGARFVLAGGLLYAFARPRSARPTLAHWRSAAIVGGLLLFMGNGLVCWAETSISSGLAALLVTTAPLFFALFDWLAFKGPRPTLRAWVALAFGFAGVALLVGPVKGMAAALPALALLVASIAWTWGSLLSRQLPLPENPAMGTAMEMLAGGAFLLAGALVTGQLGEVDARAFEPRALLALAYLTLFGSIVGFSAYVWLLRNASARAVSTYAFVNPLVAVVLGWAILDEELKPRHLIAAALIVTSVALLTLSRRR